MERKRLMKTAWALIFMGVVINGTGLCFGQHTEYEPCRYTAFGGAGLTSQSKASHGSIHFGGDYGYIPVFDFMQFPYGFIFEFGYAGPTNHFGSGSALISTNYAGELLASRKRLTLLFTSGYTRLFGTGNAVNYGGGVNLYGNDQAYAIRFEVRDYFRIVKREHNVAFRLGFSICICH